jgi:hypothetical protein
MAIEDHPQPQEQAPRTPNQIINDARRGLVHVQDDVRQITVVWASDYHRAATDISINSLMEAHLHIAEAIKALNKAQRHTED